MNLETQILEGIFWQSTFQEQASLITELVVSDFKDEESKHVYMIFSNILIKRMLVDNISIYTLDKELGLKFGTVGKTESISQKKVSGHIKMLKERNYRDEVRNRLNKWHREIQNQNNTDEFDEIKNKIIIGLSQSELDAGSKFINPAEFTAKIDENMSKDAMLEGPSWGLTDLDTYTSGIVIPRMIVVGGLKKTGKSRFIINTMFNLYKQKRPCVFLSLEMPGYEVTKLIYSRYTLIPDFKFRSISFMTKEEKAKYDIAKKEIDWNLLPVECGSSLNINQVLSRIRLYQRIYKNPIIFIDFLQRIDHDETRQAQELEKISKALANASRMYEVTIIILAQLSNIAEREDASIGHLKGSGGIGENADTILLLTNLFRKSKNEADKGKFEILIEQRYGDSGIIKCVTDLGTCSFGDNISSNTLEQMNQNNNYNFTQGID